DRLRPGQRPRRRRRDRRRLELRGRAGRGRRDDAHDADADDARADDADRHDVDDDAASLALVDVRPAELLELALAFALVAAGLERDREPPDPRALDVLDAEPQPVV